MEIKYTPTIPKEVLNTLLHIFYGTSLCYVFLPDSPLWLNSLVWGFVGFLRELYQILVQKKIQPVWVHTLDISGWIFGAILYDCGRAYFTQIDILTWLIFNL